MNLLYSFLITYLREACAREKQTIDNTDFFKDLIVFKTLDKIAIRYIFRFKFANQKFDLTNSAE